MHTRERDATWDSTPVNLTELIPHAAKGLGTAVGRVRFCLCMCVSAIYQPLTLTGENVAKKENFQTAPEISVYFESS